MEQEVYLEFDHLEDRHWWFRARRRYLGRLISTYFPTQSSSDNAYEFCEIGSGTGGNLAMLANFAVVDAVEMNTVARGIIEKKKSSYVRDLRDGSLPNDIDFSGPYDGVFSLDVIEHVDQDLAAIRRLSELAKGDGYIITTVPAYQWLWSQHDVANHHKRRYTLKQYRQLFVDAGLNVHYASYFNTLLFPLAAMSRMMGRILPNRASEAEGTLTMPSKLVNTVLNRVFNIESNWAGKFSMPFGLSIVVVASRTGT